MLALLGKLGDRRKVIRRILKRVATLSPHERRLAVHKLLVLSELRGLEDEIKEGASAMPIVVDVSNSSWFKEAYAKGLDAGMQKGLQKGLQKGQTEAAGKLLLLLLKERFGPLPRSVTARIKKAELETIEQWSLRVLRAPSLEKVFE